MSSPSGWPVCSTSMMPFSTARSSRSTRPADRNSMTCCCAAHAARATSLLISFGSTVSTCGLCRSARRQALQAVLPKGSVIVSEALSVEGRGCELFELMCTNDLEGIVAKHFVDAYDPRVRWLKIKNRDYTQKEGRGDLFERSNRQRLWRRDERDQ